MGEFERWETTPPGFDRQEIEWWERYSDVEEEYCWVQTPAIQGFLRGAYIRSIAEAIPRGGSVLEVGCGTGWLSLHLARCGSFQVWGVDFSPEQIRRANAACEREGLSDRVRFCLLNSSLSDLAEILPGQTFDVLLVHGVLHHLANDEIRALFAAFCHQLSARVRPCSYSSP